MIPTPKPFGSAAGGNVNIINPLPTPVARTTAPPTTAGPPMSAPPTGFAPPPTAGGPAPRRVGRYVVDDAVMSAARPQPPAQQPARPPVREEVSSPASSAPAPVAMQSHPAGTLSPSSPAASTPQVHLSSPTSQTVLAAPDAALQCPDAFMVLTQGVVASSADLQKKSRLPFGATCRPLSTEYEVPCVNMGPAGIVRCKACRAYINPFVEFFEGGRKWRCNLCGAPNEVAGAYFAPVDANGRRTDMDRRPELHSGVVDFVAPAEYMVRPPMAPAYLFVLDVSYYSVQSGLVASALGAIRASLDHLPANARTRVGIITYDSSVHLYRCDKTQPSMVVVADVDDAALEPCAPDVVLCPLESARGCFNAALTAIESAYATTTVQDSAVGPALRLAYYVGKAWGCKVLLYTGSLSKMGAAGGWALPPREQEGAKAIGSEDENKLLKPASESWKNLGVEMSKAQMGVDVFSFAPYADLASLGSLASVTGGRVRYYGTETFKHDLDRQGLFYDTFYTLAPEQAWEGVMRLRCSKGVSVNGTNVFGNFHIRSTDLLALPNVDHTQAYTFQLKVEEQLVHIKRVSFQVALLYTSTSSERRIRVLNKCLPVSGSLADVFRTAHCEAIADLLCKMAVARALEQRIPVSREAVLNCCVDMLRVYKQSFSAGSLGELVIPESLKALPFYVLGLLKSPMLRVAVGERLDRRSALFNAACSWPYQRTTQFLMPRMYAVRDEQLHTDAPLKLTFATVVEQGGVVAIDNTVEIVFFVTRAADVSLLATLFAVTAFEQVPVALPLVDSPVSTNVNASVQALRTAWGGWSRVSVVKEGDARTAEVLGWLIEDKTHNPPHPSLPEFVRQLQSLIAQAK